MAHDVRQESLELHERLRGKIRIQSTCSLESKADLALVYSPGVGAVSQAIASDSSLVDRYTWRKNTVAIISDGSAVLGFGDIGHLSALPVLEGKSAIFKRFSDIDAIPIVLDTKDVDAFVETVSHIASSFGAIQLEDVSAPRCFEIERRLVERLDMPVMHDDQHGTAIVALAGLINALRVVGKELSSIKVVINGAGAAGVAIARLFVDAKVGEVIMCDRQGAIYEGREGLNAEKYEVASITNRTHLAGTLADVASGADVLIGVSVAGAFTAELVKRMSDKPIVFALANPVPEIDPELALSCGVAVFATGRSDYPNQVNNALCYPGIFRGMLDHDVRRVTSDIKIRVAFAIASAVKTPTFDCVIPSIFEPGLHELVARSVVD